LCSVSLAEQFKEIFTVVRSLMGFARKRPILYLDLAAGLLPVVGLAVLARYTLDAPLRFIAATVLVYASLCALIGWRWPRPACALGAANRVTLLRGGLISLIAGTLVVPQALTEHANLVAVVALLALVLDGLDGWVARHTGSASAFGARFDMELDAFFILVLCLCLVTLGKVGAWVVAIGALRYVFVLAMRLWAWLDQPLPDSLRRKLICVWQVVSLLLCLSSWVDTGLANILLGMALLLLVVSFSVDVAWLFRHRGESVEPVTGPGASGVQSVVSQPEATAFLRNESHDQQGARP
jgi:phosphatidylglycerophosphate synthase